MKSLAQVRRELLSKHKLPQGYKIDCDHGTDNLLVMGPSLGFAITRLAIDSGYYKAEFSASIDALIRAENA